MKIINTLLVFLVLISCQQPTSSTVVASVDPGVQHLRIVKNSLWQTVKTEVFFTPRSLSGDLQSEVISYNAQSIDDFWRVFIDTAPDIDAAPPVTVYVCNPLTGDINSYWPDITRRSLVENIDAWKSAFPSQSLYIDHIPPPPIQDKLVNPYAWYAIYLVDKDTGDIFFEDHCGYKTDQSWSSDLIDPTGIDQYYSIRLNSFESQAGVPQPDAKNVIHTNWYIVTKKIYVKPGTI